MEPKEHIDQKVWDYLDGNLNGNELEEVKRKISSDEEWRTAVDAASFLHKELRSHPAEQPSGNFSAKVMQSVQAPAKQKNNGNGVVIALAAFFLSCIVFLLIKAASSEEWHTGNGLFSSAATTLSEEYNYVKGNVIYLLMATNVVLMLVLVDRVISRTPKRSNPGNLL